MAEAADQVTIVTAAFLTAAGDADRIAGAEPCGEADDGALPVVNRALRPAEQPQVREMRGEDLSEVRHRRGTSGRRHPAGSRHPTRSAAPGSRRCPARR